MKKNKKILLILGLVLARFNNSFADEISHKAIAQELVVIVNSKEDRFEIFQSIVRPIIDNMRSQGIDENKIAEVKVAADVYINNIINDTELNEKTVALYVNMFSEDEINSLLAFYKSPIGAKTLKVMPQIIDKANEIVETTMAKYQDRFKSELDRIVPQEIPVEEKPDQENQPNKVQEPVDLKIDVAK